MRRTETMKKHSTMLLDRRVSGDKIILRGEGIDVTVLPENESDARELRGNSNFQYVYRGGKAFFVPPFFGED
jgi:hypothetical protein